MIRRFRTFAALVLPLIGVLALASALIGCSGSSSDDNPSPSLTAESGESGESNPAGNIEISASLASFDLSTARPQRVMVGFSTAESELLAGGTVSFSFRYAGTATTPIDPPEAVGVTAEATFLPVPGDVAAADTSEVTQPRLGPPSAGRGVYAAHGVVFDRAGYWQLEASAKLADGTFAASTTFEVTAKSRVPDIGDPAPTSANLSIADIGDNGINAAMVDSRADPVGTGSDIADPELHRLRIADSLKAGRAVVVVVSTPAFCQSLFCGPITDIVDGLRPKYADRVDFVHLELWRDFEKSELNAAPAAWVIPKDAPGQGKEPWIFVVGKDGRIAARFDNLAAVSDLEAALKAVV